MDDTNKPLARLGWGTFFQEKFDVLNEPGTVPARVISESKGSCQLITADGELTGVIAGKLRRHGGLDNVFPAVGDWVAVKPLPGEDKGIIQVVLPRKSKFSRKVAGELTAEQVVSANVDNVFIVSGLDGGRNFNLRRIERYLVLAWNSGAVPVIVLNKIDICHDVNDYISAVQSIAPGVAIHPVSAKERLGLDILRSYLTEGRTAAFLGSSGAGKSALVNALLGSERQQTGEVRGDDRQGRHTTTKRELILLADGGIVIDTPGMREIQIWGSEEDLQGAFGDIEAMALDCRFNNCRHESESGCAVLEALNNGHLHPSRLESYHKIKKELLFLAAKEDQNSRLQEKMRGKRFSKMVKQFKKDR
ncbi:GTPase-like protein [Dehalogenimonas sp. WBC-2]|nr:GTPase-like protein [Dehalogenimonas sp. WBC-2]